LATSERKQLKVSTNDLERLKALLKCLPTTWKAWKRC